MTLPFDSVLVERDGRRVRLSSDEFLVMNFVERVELILGRRVQFFQGERVVERNVALHKLRQLALDSDAARPSVSSTSGDFSIDCSSLPGVIKIRLWGLLTPARMQQFLAAHKAAANSFAGEPYHVFCDSRDLLPMSPESAALLESVKNYSAEQANFQGSAVWSRSPVTTMQHLRTSSASGVAATELVSDDEQACWKHIARVRRSRAT